MRRKSLLGLAAVLAIATPLFAHTALTSSSPARDAVLDRAPTELVLHYNERIDPELARVRLLRHDSTEVSLGELRSGDSAQIVVAPITGRLRNGVHTVDWQVIGRDGHPVRGRFAFTLAAPEPVDTPPPVPVAAPGPAGVVPASPEGGPESALTVGSPAYVAIRWLTYAAIMIAIGAVAFRDVVLSALRRSAAAPPGLVESAAARAATIGRGALVFLLLAAGARLLAQASAVAMPGDEGMMQTVLFGTTWGWAWLLQVAAAAAGILAFHFARRTPRAWTMAGLVASLLALTLALSGHPAAVERFATAAVLIDALHVLAVSAWLGTLVFVVGVGVPETRSADGGGQPALSAMVNAFSPAALVFAGTAAATGVISAAFQLGALSPLWTSAYGRTLLLKLVAVALVIAAGAYNWRRLRPALTGAAPADRLRASGGAELIAAAVVLLITAILVAVPTP